MTVRGTIRGNSIHFKDLLPFKEGEEVRVDIEPAGNGVPAPGTAEAAREAMKGLRPVPADVADELERIIDRSNSWSETPRLGDKDR